MQQAPTTSPVRGALFYSAGLLLLLTVGSTLQSVLGLGGIILQQLLLFLGLAVAFALFLERRPLREVFRLRGLTFGGVVKSITLGACAWGLVQLLGYLMVLLVQESGGKIPQLYTDLAQTSFAVALVTRGLLPAICEEMAFRGYVQWTLGPLGRRTAVVLTAVLFGAMHGTVIRLIPLSLLGLIFAATVQRAGSIFPSMIMHFTNNAIALSLSYFVRTDSVSLPVGLPILLGGAVLLGAVVWLLVRSFGPGDVAATAGETGPDRPESAVRILLPAVVVSLLPGLLIYSFLAASELVVVWGRH